MRGRLYQQYRPISSFVTTLENAITTESPPITEKIIRLLDETKGGMAGHGACLTVGNFIIENRVMGYIHKAVDGSGGRVRFVPIVDRQGVISWPDKYVKTDDEAVVANRDIPEPSKRKISLEASGANSTRGDGGSTRSKCFLIQSRPDPLL